MANNHLKFTHSAHISPKGKPKTSQSQMWGMLVGGLVCGFLGMYLTVTRPMAERMEMLETDIALMQTEMHQLVGTRDDLWKTNDLLTGLRQQQRQLGEASQALAALRELKNEAIALAGQQQMAMNTLQQASQLQQAIIDQQAAFLQSQEALAQVESFRQEAVELGQSLAGEQSQLKAALQTVETVKVLADRTISQESSLQSAQQVMNSVDKLSGSLLARQESLGQASEVVQQIDALQNQLTAQAEKLPTAVQSFEQMAALENRLVEHDTQLTTKAEENLSALTMIGTELSTGSERITSALQTIELLEDFQSEMQHQATLLTNMRRDLMEITFLESTVKQTLHILKPLIQLTDMRRMSDTEVREAARVIMDRRLADSRLHKDELPASQTAEQLPATEAPRTAIEIQEPQVPAPIDLN